MGKPGAYLDALPMHPSETMGSWPSRFPLTSSPPRQAAACTAAWRSARRA